MPVAPAVLARMTPYLQRLMTSRPDIWGRFVASAKGAGHAVGNTAKEAVAYIKANPLNATAVLSLLASAGASITDLWSPSDKAETDQRALVLDLDAIFLTSQGVDATGVQRIHDSADKSQELKGLMGNVSDLHTARAILAWARSHYGSQASAMRAHSLHQAFFEMSREDVQNGYEVLDV